LILGIIGRRSQSRGMATAGMAISLIGEWLSLMSVLWMGIRGGYV
jgi:hypothetical protein